MKKALSLLSLACLLAAGIPAAEAATLLRGDCTVLTGPLQNRCLRRSERSADDVNAKEYRMENRDVIEERRLLRRSDLQERGLAPATKSIEKLREERKEDLKNRRAETNENFQMRHDQSEVRLKNLMEERSKQLRSRFESVPGTEVMEKGELRSRAKRLHERSQIRRDGIKRAHEACSGIGATERLKCMEEQREASGSN